MKFEETRIAQTVKSLALIYGFLSELGVLIFSIVVGTEFVDYYSDFNAGLFFTILIVGSLSVLLTATLLYAGGVLVENVIMIRIKVVGSDKELGIIKHDIFTVNPVPMVMAKKEEFIKNSPIKTDYRKEEPEKTEVEKTKPIKSQTDCQVEGQIKFKNENTTKILDSLK